jgi:hypothetical protein
MPPALLFPLQQARRAWMRAQEFRKTPVTVSLTNQ